MPNSFRNGGFRLANSRVADTQSQLRVYPATNGRHATGGGIFVGDAVHLNTSGFIVPAASTASTGASVIGVVAAVTKLDAAPTNVSIPDTMANPTNLDRSGMYLAPGEFGWVWVIPAEGNTFEAVNVHTSTTVAIIGDLVSIVGTTTGSALTATTVADGPDTAHGASPTFISTMAVNTSLTTNPDVRVLGVSYSTDSGDNTAANSRILVEFNNPQFQS